MKNISAIVATAAFLFMPFASFAQTVDQLDLQTQYQSLLVQLISALEQQVVELTNQLIALQDTQKALTTQIQTHMATNDVQAPSGQAAPTPRTPEIDLGVQDGATYTEGQSIEFKVRVLNIDESHPKMEFSTSNPDGFDRVYGYTGDQTPTATDQSFVMSKNGGNGVINSVLHTPGTYTYTLKLPDYNITQEITITVVPAEQVEI